MAKRRTGHQDEVLLIPFLDILCSLIGVLILIIVVLTVAQMRKAGGRTRQDLEIAQKFQDLQKQKKELAKSAEDLKKMIAELENRRDDLTAKQDRLVELRKRLTLSADEARNNKDLAAAAQKQVEDLLRRIEALAKDLAPLQTEIDALKKQIALKQKKPDDKPPSVIVRPSGSGSGRNQRLFFVEASGAGILVHREGGEPVRVAKESIGLDKDYNAFLKEVAGQSNAQLLFLVRRDGWWNFQKAAGWAEQEFKINTGKLPIPGDGPVDLGLFRKN